MLVVTLVHFYCGLRQAVALPLSGQKVRVVTLVHFYCGLRLYPLFIKKLPPLIVVTLVHFYCGLRREQAATVKENKASSNPCPFLLWIATSATCARVDNHIGSNPCPFLLWIATMTMDSPKPLTEYVVTLVHFYCGLRPKYLSHRACVVTR